MAEPEQAEHVTLDEACVVARVTRYSSLRGVERALLPSVRKRVLLPTTRLGARLLGQLQALLEQIRACSRPTAEQAESLLLELAEVDEALERFAGSLTAMIRDTPLAQLRSTLPDLLERSRGEVGALLDLWLESFAPEADGVPFKIDFLVTLLARQRVGGIALLGGDPSRVTPGVARLCDEHEADPDYRAPELARLFRDAHIELLGLDDLEEIIDRMRTVKSRLGRCLFDRDVLRAVVSYNIAADNRFRELLDLESRKDAVVERTLNALNQLDHAAPADEPRPSAELPEALNSPGMRALEEALRDRLTRHDRDPEIARRLAESIDLSHLDPTGMEALLHPREDLGHTLTRAAIVVGLALRDLPSLRERLGDLDIDVSRMKTDWVRELDEALQAAIETLARSGRSDQAARLSTTRMRYLSGD